MAALTFRRLADPPDSDCAICLRSLQSGSAAYHEGNRGNLHPLHTRCISRLFSNGLNRCPSCNANISDQSLADCFSWTEKLERNYCYRFTKAVALVGTSTGSVLAGAIYLSGTPASTACSFAAGLSFSVAAFVIGVFSAANTANNFSDPLLDFKEQDI